MPQFLGDKIHYLRRRLHLTQAEFVHWLGLTSQAHISNIELGRRQPAIDLVLQIAEQVGVSVEYLVRDSFPVEVDLKSIQFPRGQAVSQLQLVGAKVRSLRQQHGLTQGELASQLELANHTHLSLIESGKKLPSIDLILRLADLFHVSMDYLVRDSIPIEQG